MSWTFKSVAVVGSGAIGLYYGGRLAAAGEDVRFLVRSDFDAISRDGLKVESAHGDFELPEVKVYRTPQEIGPVDLVLIGLKTFANSSFAELVGPLIGAGTQILTLQNGLGNEEALAELFGRDRILGGVAFLCSNRGTPGEVHHLGAGRVVLGEYHRCDRERLNRVVSLFVNAGVECRATDDLKRSRWEKLVWNIPFNGLCALLQQPVNLLLAQPACRRLVHELMLEVIAAANAQGISKPIPNEFAASMLEFTDNMGEYRPSMQIDRAEGRPLEIAAIFRAPLKLGRSQSIEMPRTEMLATLLEQASH